MSRKIKNPSYELIDWAKGNLWRKYSEGCEAKHPDLAMSEAIAWMLATIKASLTGLKKIDNEAAKITKRLIDIFNDTEGRFPIERDLQTETDRARLMLDSVGRLCAEIMHEARVEPPISDDSHRLRQTWERDLD